MTKSHQYLVAGICVALVAGAFAISLLDKQPMPKKKTQVDLNAISTNVATPTSYFMLWDLKGKGATDMLHGYLPSEGDAVEWYMRDVDCSKPDDHCTFELAIRKKPTETKP